jgi:asparagine synthetase B (glutamine-hydrolysing)
MCGILFVESRHAIPLEKHLEALQILQSRGPDFTRYEHRGNQFVAQTVLHVTGTADFYNRTGNDFFAYNGEIYDFLWYGRYSNDIELVYHAAHRDHRLFRYFEGPWAWVHTDFDRVMYASDPQGEHYLYRYQDDDIVIVCSEVAPILCYINTVKVPVLYVNKSWTLQQQTPWQGIERLEPGRLYINHEADTSLDDIWSWINPRQDLSFEDAYREFDSIWTRAMRIIKPECATVLSYSGGLDSSIILPDLNPSQLIVTNMTGKDPIADRVKEFLTPKQQQRLTQVHIDYEQYAQHYLAVIDRTRMPVQSWSYVGKWIVAQACQARVLFSGQAADELFGGYDVYRNISYTTEHSTSPYSLHIDSDTWQKCLAVYNNDPRQATLLADYWCQIVGSDGPGSDRIGGAHGIETRNPFQLKSVMTFALNLPWEFKVSNVGKPLIRKKFLERWPEDLVLPKMGFAGHANDSLPWLGVEIDSTGDRHRDWQQIAQKTFYKHA